MIKCEKCKELIGHSAPVYKASRGFIGADNVFHEDESVIFHMECYHSYDPFGIIETKIKNS